MAPGDSGGPVFAEVNGEWLVAGINSFTMGKESGIGTDIDLVNNSTVGEVGAATNLNYKPVYEWIYDVVWNEKRLSPSQSWNGSWEDPLAWTNSTIPSANHAVSIDISTSNYLSILGPSSNQSIESLEIGAGSGYKQLLHSAGGSLSMAGDITIDTNGSIALEDGSLSADNLIIQSTASVPQTPTPENAYFLWTDDYIAGTTSLTVNRIEVGDNGAFEYNWSNSATASLTKPGGGYVDLDVLASGQAIFQQTNNDIGDVTNSGILSLGGVGAGNSIGVGSYTQYSGGMTELYISSSNIDALFVYGTATLAGTLELELWQGLAPTSGYADIISAYNLIGTYDNVVGFNDLGNGFWMSLSYVSDASYYYLVGRIQMIGDLDGDGFVGLNDLDRVLGHWNQNVTAGVGLEGDVSGDGYVGLEDLDKILNNWNQGTPPALPDFILIPEPGTLITMLTGMMVIGNRPKRSHKSSQSYAAEKMSTVRGRTMTGWKKGIVVALLLCFVTSQTEASISLDLIPVDNTSALTGYTTYNIHVTTITDWTGAAMLLDITSGSIYQHAYGENNAAPNPYFITFFPELEFDTYVIGNSAGGAGDVGGDGYTFNTSELDVTWYNLTDSDIGSTTIGRLTITDDTTGSMSVMLTADDEDAVVLTIPISAGIVQTAIPAGGEMLSTCPTIEDVWVPYIMTGGRILETDHVDTRIFVPDPSTAFKPVTFVSQPAPSGGSLPEPASLMLVSTGLVAVLQRRLNH